MSLNANDVPMGNGGNRVTQPAMEVGGYDGRVSQVIDLGIQDQGFYEGKHKGFKHSLAIAYELSDEFMVDENGNVQEDRPRVFTEDFAFNNLKQEKAKSTQRYLAIDPTNTCNGDFTKLVGMPCVINLIPKAGKGVHAGKTFTNIRDVSAIRPKQAEKLPPLVNPPKVFLFDTPDMDVFNSLPEWLQDRIKGAQNYEGSKLEALVNGNAGNAPAPEEPKLVPTEEEGKEEW